MLRVSPADHPGFGPLWAVTRHEGVRAMLADGRFVLTAESYAMRPRGVPEEYEPYLRTMQQMDGPEHLRLRRLVSPAFTPHRLTGLRSDPDLMPRAVEELIRWCGPQLLAIPRYATEDVVLDGVLIRAGEPVVAVLASANRDPRMFTAPDRLDVTRTTRPQDGHLGFGHGPHYCLGAALARIETEVALTTLLRRFPDLALAVAPRDIERVPDPATWRLATLPIRI